MKYKIIEIPDNTKLSDKKYVVEIVTSEGISFLKSNSMLVETMPSDSSAASLTTRQSYALTCEYTAFSSLEAAKQALAKFILENPIYSKGKRIVEEGEI